VQFPEGERIERPGCAGQIPALAGNEDGTEADPRGMARKPLVFVGDRLARGVGAFLGRITARDIPRDALGCGVDVDLARLVVGPIGKAPDQGILGRGGTRADEAPVGAKGADRAVAQPVKPADRHGQPLLVRRGSGPGKDDALDLGSVGEAFDAGRGIAGRGAGIDKGKNQPAVHEDRRVEVDEIVRSLAPAGGDIVGGILRRSDDGAGGGIQLVDARRLSCAAKGADRPRLRGPERRFLGRGGPDLHHHRPHRFRGQFLRVWIDRSGGPGCPNQTGHQPDQGKSDVFCKHKVCIM